MATLDFPLGRFTLLGGDEQVFYQWRSVFPLESTRYAAITTTTYTTTAQMTFGLTFAFSNRSVLLQTKDEGRRTKDLLIYDVHETETIWYFYAYSTRDILISPLCPSDSKARLLSTVGNWGLFYSAPQVFVVWGSF